jgi:hypothetical protein
MLKQTGLTVALVAALAILATSHASAAMPSPAPAVAPGGIAEPAAYKAKHRYVVHGTVRPRRGKTDSSGPILPSPSDQFLLNLPQAYNPVEPPFNDGIRQSYPGLGLYR